MQNRKNSDMTNYLSAGLQIVGCIALLMYGMKVMSDALQRMAGRGLRHILGRMTTNRVSGVLTGALVTVAVQSSAATTVMTVSFVNAGLLNLAQAISVIMGANIGTTMSAWIMSVGFSFNITSVVWPMFLIAIILIHTKSRRFLGDFIFGLSFMLFALGMLQGVGRSLNLAENQAVVDFFASFNSESYITILAFLLIGTVLTCIAQSSAALMAITMLLCSTGVLTIYQGIALVLGENIGTTLTANLAALTGNTQARRAAFAHLFFNVFGVIWVLCLFYPFVRTVCRVVGLDPAAQSLSPMKLSFTLATFHTLFNLTNTFILIWFIPQIEKIACKVIKTGRNDDDISASLKFIQVGIIKTPEISVLQAQKEIQAYAESTAVLFGKVRELSAKDDNDGFERLFDEIKRGEDQSDRMESAIGKYLGQVSDAHLSDETKAKIRAMLREISELESIADGCFNLARAYKRKRDSGIAFTENQEANLEKMFTLVSEAIGKMTEVLAGSRDHESSFRTESAINELRNTLKEQNIMDLDSHEYSYACGTVYLDIVTECEKCGDYVINVVEAKFRSNDKTDHGEE